MSEPDTEQLIPRRLAMIGLDDGTLLALDAESGRWVGPRADEANEIATIADATPDQGEPAVWVGQSVQARLGGELRLMVRPTSKDPDTIH